MDGDDAPGWFGKISSLGDFAHRRLPPAWLRACDAWLSQALRASQAALGDRWLDVYLTAPLQRFAWAPGVIDDAWWFGLFMPSCDCVGRYFPLLIAQSRDGVPQDRAAFDQLERWYDHLVAAAMRTLDERGTPMEALEEALHESIAWTFPTVPGGGIFADAGTGRRVLAPPASLGRWAPALASAVLLESLAGCSLWWPVGPRDEPGTLRLVRGLPCDEDFVDLLASR